MRYLHAGRLHVEDVYLSSTLPGADVFINLLFKFSAQIPGRDDVETMGQTLKSLLRTTSRVKFGVELMNT